MQEEGIPIIKTLIVEFLIVKNNLFVLAIIVIKVPKVL